MQKKYLNPSANRSGLLERPCFLLWLLWNRLCENLFLSLAGFVSVCFWRYKLQEDWKYLSSVITLCHPNPDLYLYLLLFWILFALEKKCSSLGKRKQLGAEENDQRLLDSFPSFSCILHLGLLSCPLEVWSAESWVNRVLCTAGWALLLAPG